MDFLSSLMGWTLSAPEFALGFIVTTILIIFVPWQSNFKPLNSLLNATEDKKDILTKLWREQKLSELTYVGVACAILASIVTGAIAWPPSPSSPPSPWITMATWYSSLILALTAISSATQQSLTLYRLGCYEDCSLRLRKILGYEQRRKDGSTFWTARWTQLFVWQIPVMLLNFSILLFVAGLLAVLKERAAFAGGSLSNIDVKIAVFAGAFSGIAFLSYMLGMLSLYYQVFQNAA